MWRFPIFPASTTAASSVAVDELKHALHGRLGRTLQAVRQELCHHLVSGGLTVDDECDAGERGAGAVTQGFDLALVVHLGGGRSVVP